jgi:hypothetical protein
MITQCHQDKPPDIPPPQPDNGSPENSPFVVLRFRASFLVLRERHALIGHLDGSSFLSPPKVTCGEGSLESIPDTQL